MKHAAPAIRASFACKLCAFAFTALALILADRVSKAWADSHEVGDLLVGDVAGLFEFRLVHNTGGAWGIFSDSTFALGVFSLTVCLFILVILFTYIRKEGNLPQSLFLGMVFAGGVGNAVDRFAHGYVVDFINATFIAFPVFNIADIGVTCGLVLFFVASLVQERRTPTEKQEL